MNKCRSTKDKPLMEMSSMNKSICGNPMRILKLMFKQADVAGRVILIHAAAYLEAGTVLPQWWVPGASTRQFDPWLMFQNSFTNLV